MNITYTADNTLNSTVVDTATGNALYEISTELGNSGQSQIHSTTTIWDLRRGGREAVAVWARAYIRDNDCVTVNAHSRPLAEWLRKKDPLSRTWMLVVPSGAEYAWEEKSRPKGTFECLHYTTQRTVATSHPGRRAASKGIMSKLFGMSRSSSPTTLNLDLEPEVASGSVLPSVLLSFAILECARRDQVMGNTAFLFTKPGVGTLGMGMSTAAG